MIISKKYILSKIYEQNYVGICYNIWEFIQAEDVLELTFDVEDDLSGINNVVLDYTIGNIGYIDVYAHKDENGKYKLLIDINENMIYKTINFNSLIISDKAGNELVYGYDKLNKYKVQVTDINGLFDSSSPKLNKFEVSTKTPKVGDKFEIYVDATDDLSGINDMYMNIFIKEYSGEFNSYANLLMMKK